MDAARHTHPSIGKMMTQDLSRLYSGDEFPGLKTTVFDHFWAVLGAYKRHCVAVHLGVKMADTLSFTAKVDMVDF